MNTHTTHITEITDADVAARHAHTVQLARKEAADPQLVLPLGAEEILP